MRAGIGFGSNLGDRQANLRRARNYLRTLQCVAAIRASGPLFETSPVGCDESAGNFLNSVVEVELTVSARPECLLAGVRGIEVTLGRPTRYPKNASRPIDLDLLYVGDLTRASPLLVLPHPRMHQRRFVLAPLAAIRPDLVLPGHQRSVVELLDALDDPEEVRLLSESW